MNLFTLIKNWFTKQKIHPETHTISTNTIDTNTKTSTLIEWSSSNPTYGPYHWWPWKSFKHTNSLKYIHNNLYAEGGCLDKYDQLFHIKSVEYQKKHYFRHQNSLLSDKDWAGFCDKAAILSCLYEYPKHCVYVKYNAQIIKFTQKDIEGLMIIACNNSIIDKQSFYGERYNGMGLEDKKEPYPTKLLSILRIMCEDDTPFCVDTCNDKSVWNYPMSNVKVIKYNTKPSELNTYNYNVPKTGITYYYNFKLSNESYPHKHIDIWGWVNYTNNHKTEGWISEKTPDFLWRTYKKYTEWEGMCTINPEVSCNHVYKIYQHSVLSRYNSTDMLLL